jgi:pentose-5-phosphate-3-epimerase
METERQRFYSQSALSAFAPQDVLDGRVVKINPAIITLTDGLVDKISPGALQRSVQDQVMRLVRHKIRTFHVDVNFPDYAGYERTPPAVNTGVFTPEFLGDLNALVRSEGGFLNLHLLTDTPSRQLRRYDHIQLGAVCFQLDAVSDSHRLRDLINHIVGMGACASPVIETVGSDGRAPRLPQEVLDQLEPVMTEIGMLTFQAAGTASRSNSPADPFAEGQVRRFVGPLKKLRGTIQLQGGITMSSIGAALGLGAEFLVIGTQLFHHPAGLSPTRVVDELLETAARVLI